MTKNLAKEILKTVAPSWYVEGTAIVPEYANILEEQGLIVKVSDGKYKRTKEGMMFSGYDNRTTVTTPISFTEDPSDILESYFRF